MLTKRLYPTEYFVAILVRRITVFAEDLAHEQVLGPLINRLTKESGQDLDLTWANARGGHSKVVRELKQFLRDIKQQVTSYPDLVVVATDGNCKGFHGRRREITDLTDQVSARTICAIPDPHVERWLMIDSAAFKSVFDVGCDAPPMKCQRDLYKRLLVEAIRKAGISPSLGGIEFADDIVAALDIDRTASADSSFGHFVRDFRAILSEWAR